ncbi:hypothetical protein PV08_02914 [Exophiala spinifera]|uniref:J domain-containing protein n=1 Tax=Exophiala spinifera TaxID=91928 RepID=A0A0D2BJ69_9EURO|nr:uncharacterized protein PV08_02914 [Exophiala spinifera]KIW18625.1 hypothetical protein PV08_02914 [Exophiala spinifera]
MILRPTSFSTITSLRIGSFHGRILDQKCTRTRSLSTYASTNNSTPNLKLKSPKARGQIRAFSHSRLRSSSADPPNHYAILRMPPDATASELKKQFYVLSKETHPDRNRQDPKAAERFAQISESYSVLANPEKRRRYDRDVYHVHHGHHSHSHSRAHHAHGHHSSHTARKTYAGSRPATGLSKRRSAFKGPPPSFYAHGKPSANTTSHAQAQAQAGTFNSAAFTDADAAGTGFAFDPQSTFKTQTHEDYRRANRRAAEVEAARAAAAEENDFWGRFIVVAGVIVLGVSVGTIVISMANTPRGGLTRADGSRRDGPRNEWTKA